MKKIVSLFSLFFVAIACNPSDDTQDIVYESQPILNVTLPDTIAVFDENEIEVEYLRPSTCHGFGGFYYDKEGLTRTIAVQTYFYQNNNCETLTNDVKHETLKFEPTVTGTYTFRFWQGKDVNGQDVFLEIQRPSKIY